MKDSNIIAAAELSAGKRPISTKMWLKAGCCLLALSVVGGFSLAAEAQEAPRAQVAATKEPGTVEEVIVTANKRPENVQKVAASVSAFSGLKLEEQNLTNFADIAHITPDLQISTSISARQTEISLRDFGTTGINAGLEPDVGLFLDGVYQPAASATLNDLVDISTFEVLRGPQGTLAGRNTPVGEVNITTRAPTQAFEAMADVELGNYNERRFTGYVGGGITNNLAGRLTFWSDTHSGYEKDLATGADVSSRDDWGLRGRLRWTPDASTTVDVIAYYSALTYDGFFQSLVNPYGPGGIVGRIGTPQASYGPNSTFNFLTNWNSVYPTNPLRTPGPFQTDSQDPGDQGRNATYGASVQVDHQLPFGATVTNILAYNALRDSSKIPINGLPLEAAADFPEDDWSSESDELRIVSNGTHFIDYVAGIYLYHQDLNFVPASLIWLPPANLNRGGLTLTPGQHAYSTLRETENDVAAYAQVTAHITDALRITGGIRQSWDHKHGTGSQYTNEPDGTPCATAGLGEPSCALANALTAPFHYSKGLEDDPLTGLLTIQYDLTKGVMAYYTMSNGFKDGGFVAQLQPLKPEESDNYEVGLKSSVFNQRLLVNIDVYRMVIGGLQLSALAPGGTTFTTVNAGKIGETGVELDTQLRPIDHLTINGALSYIDSRYDSYVNAPCVANYPYAGAPVPAGSPPKNTSGPYTGACNQTGFTPPNSPRWTWSVSAQWRQQLASTPADWFVQAGAHGVSGQYLDPSLDPRSYQQAYTLVDAMLGVQAQNGRWKVQLYAKNLANQAYYQAITAGGLYGTYVINGKSPSGYTGYWGQPRTFGIELTVKY